MRVVYAVIALLLIPSLSWAGNMTFQFRNPNFGETLITALFF